MSVVRLAVVESDRDAMRAPAGYMNRVKNMNI